MFKTALRMTTLLVIASLALAMTPVTAKNSADNVDRQSVVLPEEEGTYNVPGQPGMKLKVFVYKDKPAKPGKPGPAPDPDPDCTLTDNNEPGDPVAYAGWQLSKTTAYQYWLNPGSVPAAVGTSSLETIAANAFKPWQDAAQVTVEKAGDTAKNRAVLDGYWIISWGRINASALGMTYVWYYPDTGQVVELDTIMNQKYAWDWSDPLSWSEYYPKTCAYPNAYDAQNILTHELGHWFGLDDHTATAYADHTMYGYGAKMETKKDTLAAGDLAGMDLIY